MLTFAACSNDAQDDDGTPDTTTSASASGAALPDLFGVRYCEVLAVTVADTGTTGEVWGTQGLNDCPQAAFDGIDAAAVAEELEVTFTVLNGPRYWVLDRIVANEMAGSGERRDIGDIVEPGARVQGVEARLARVSPGRRWRRRPPPASRRDRTVPGPG